MSKRIWSESTLIWDKAGTELWNIVAPFIRKGAAQGGNNYMPHAEREEIMLQPMLVFEDFNPNLSREKKQILEIAGISRKFTSQKQTNEDVSIFITEVKIRTK